MSSLSATQADGYYAPPEYYESGAYKKKSVSQFHGSKGHNQYLTNGVVRFELPYNGFCEGCGEHVGKGTRFNAHKIKAGSYFSSPIYKFTMKCRVCNQMEFVIQTNPKEQSFDYLKGIHKQVQEFDSKDVGSTGVIDTEYGNKLIPTTISGQDNNGALSRLESVASGARKTMTERDELESLLTVNNRTFLNDAGSNAAIRSTFRADRKKRKLRLQNAKALGWKEGMELKDDETDHDVALARNTCYGKGKVREKKRFRTLRTSSIFDSRAICGSTRRKAANKTREDVALRPDNVNSLSSSPGKPTDIGDSSNAIAVKQEEGAGKKRIRIVAVSSGAKLERDEQEEKEKGDSLASLFADYGSDSD